MNRQRRNDFLIPLLTVLSDIVAIEGAFLLSYWLRFFSPLTQYFEVELGVPPLTSYIYSSIVFIPVWLLVFNSRHLYGTRRNTHISDELFALVRLISLCMMIMMSATFFYREFSFSRGVFILLYLTSIVLITFGRFLVMEFEKYLYRKGKELKSIVILGKNATAERICEHFLRHKELGYEILGYYADAKAENHSSLSTIRHIGTINKLVDDIIPMRIQCAMITLSHNEQETLVDLLRETEGQNIEFMMVPDLLEMLTSRVRIQEIEGFPFIKVKDISMSTWNRITKRIFDIVFSIIVLFCISPFFLLITLIIKLTSPGSVFYIQERIGLDAVPFPLIKFRSMQENIEKNTGPVRNTPTDNRATGIGKFLRRSSMDELPQFINVLAGQMSVVGPRPERPFFVEQFKNQIPRYLERHRVKAGMTGWAQVNGLRGDAPIEERTKYDIYYVENWSLVFDIKIIFKTIHAVVFGKNAY
jgi:exopolysaccharide biosynthesis polyprenyl glycosylphosphotransferase